MNKTPRNALSTRHYSSQINLDASLPPLELQHIWYELKKQRDWRSMALVPVSDDIQTLSVAHAVGLMAVREPHDLIWVVNASSNDGSRIQPADVSAQEGDGFPYKYVNLAELAVTQEKRLFTAERMLDKIVDQTQSNMRFVVSVDSIVSNTHPITLCRMVDVVILCVVLGKTTFSAVKRTVEIIGREKILGSIILKPSSSSGI